ncbi:MAG: tRNA epoxyqueuosine(34) reductase QueG [Muribaculaceae bacterium]|nr:tRNA epoxyqueuosine(34) reductase QueG [Muribaculaceae bacterium]
MEDIREHIRQLCYEAGACAAGFARIAPVPDGIAALYDDWIAAGRHGSMAYMENYSDIRRNPSMLLENARTLLSCAFFYGDSSSGLFADYAAGSDYHDVLRRALAPVAAYLDGISPGTRICVDTAPLRERFWATRAGVGYIGLNNQLIVPEVGSAVFLAEILWTGELEPDVSFEDRTCCQCGACQRACPQQALDGTGGLDASRCLSYLTIEHRGELPAGLMLPSRIYGCDICRYVCPEGRPSGPVVRLDDFRSRPEVIALTPDDIRGMTQSDFSRIFKGSAVKRAKLAGLLRNVSRHKPNS